MTWAGVVYSALFNGQIPKDDFRSEADRAAFEADTISNVNDRIKGLSIEDMTKMLRGNYVEFNRAGWY
jgi:hypothetical protein